MLQRVMSRFSVKKLLSNSTKHFVGEPVSAVFQKKSGGGNFLWKRRGRREYRNFPSKNLCLKVPKKFAGKPFSLSLNFWYRKSLCFRGLCHDFPSKTFCLTVQKYFVEETFCAVVQKFSGSEKVFG